MCSKWSKTGSNASKLGQRGSGRVKMGDRKGKEGKKVMNGLLAHPFRAKMVSCPSFQGKGGLRDHFLGVLAHNVKL